VAAHRASEGDLIVGIGKDGLGEDGLGDGLVVSTLESTWLDRAGELLGRSFVDEPGFTWSLGGSAEQRRRTLALSFRASLRARRHGMEMHGAFYQGRLVGVGVRFPPGRWAATRWQAIRGYPWRIVGLLVRAWVSRRSLRGLALSSTYRRMHDGLPPHWYLWMMGVDPEYRRHGVAAALARYVARKADQAGVGCYLETFGDETEALYRAVGFQVRDRFQLAGGALVGRTMWRDPWPMVAARSPDPGAGRARLEWKPRGPY
jgi:GNAT superfamily N-acetyltransferase